MFRDQEPDGASGWPAAILRHDEIAAARVGEPFDALQFRARRLLETRHRLRCLSLGNRAWYRQEKNKKKGEAAAARQSASLPNKDKRAYQAAAIRGAGPMGQIPRTKVEQ